MSKILLFDVNETLLDLSPLKLHFKQIFDDEEAVKVWFLTLLHSSLTVTLSENYSDFSALSGAALDVVSKQKEIALQTEDKETILETFTKLPPHKEVPASLELLRSNGFRLFTLTNSPPQMLSAQMANANLRQYFEDVFSVDETRKYKPAIETYQFAARKLGVETNQTHLIAAHDWDIAGAANAGCQTAYIARPGKVYNAFYQKPDIIGGDLSEVADKILQN